MQSIKLIHLHCHIQFVVPATKWFEMPVVFLCAKWRKRRFHQRITTSFKKKRLVIILKQKFDVIEQHECGPSNATIGLNVEIAEIAESTVEFVFLLLSKTTVIFVNHTLN